MPTSALNGVPVPRRRSNPTRLPNAPRPSLLCCEAMAEWLGVEVVFVRRLVAERRIPFVKIGKLSASTLQRSRSGSTGSVSTPRNGLLAG